MTQTMTPELTALALAGLLQVVQFALMSVPANLELGPGKTLGPRDPDRLGKPLIEQVSPRTGRLFRALNNHFEGLILFTLAVVVVTLSGQSSGCHRRLRLDLPDRARALRARLCLRPGAVAVADLDGGLRRHHPHAAGNAGLMPMPQHKPFAIPTASRRFPHGKL